MQQGTGPAWAASLHPPCTWGQGKEGVHHQPGLSPCQAQEAQGSEMARNFPKVTEPGCDLVEASEVNGIFMVWWVHTD